ncbi:hypothetical protein HY11_10955 [Hyphomonas pacifica]|nr:hypothetical protein HY11_10955 [Hyphomonas pacifica]
MEPRKRTDIGGDQIALTEQLCRALPDGDHWPQKQIDISNENARLGLGGAIFQLMKSIL